ncbi:MAG: hypothetical protein GX096_01575 [Clostridiales bacterium]|nr:hypothetical protein [Clostridiales bacterium]
MTYALIENEMVSNLIWLYEGNADDFPSAVPIGERSVMIGDHYADGVFTRDGEALLTPLEEAEHTICALDEMVVELEYQNVLLELGLLA